MTSGRLGTRCPLRDSLQSGAARAAALNGAALLGPPDQARAAPRALVARLQGVVPRDLAPAGPRLGLVSVPGALRADAVGVLRGERRSVFIELVSKHTLSPRVRRARKYTAALQAS